MRIHSGQNLQAGGLKAKTKAGSLPQSLKEGDKLGGRVLSCERDSVTLKTDDGQIVKARLEPGVTLTEGEEVTLEVAAKEDGVIFLTVSENEPDGRSAPQGALSAARGFEDTSLEPYAQKLLELKMPVREETAAAMRGLMEANPGMKPEEAAFLASNGITQESGLVKAALALLSGKAKTDELIGIMLKLLGDTPDNTGGQHPVMENDLEPNAAAAKTTNGMPSEMPKADMPATETPGADTSRVNALSATPDGQIAAAETGADPAVKIAVNHGYANEKTTITGWINSLAEQNLHETAANSASQMPSEALLHEPVLTGEATGNISQKNAQNAVPQPLAVPDDTEITPRSNNTGTIIPQSDTVLQNEFSTSVDIKSKILTEQGESIREETVISTGNQRELPQTPRTDGGQPVQIQQEPVRLPTTQPAQVPQDTAQPQSAQIPRESAQMPREPIQSQPVQIQQEPVRLPTTQSAQVSQDTTRLQSAQTQQEPVQAQPAQIQQEPVRMQITQPAQAPQDMVQQPTQIPQGAAQPQFAQVPRESAHMPGEPQTVQPGQVLREPGQSQTAKAAPDTAPLQSEPEIQETAEDKSISRSIAKILAEMPEFKGTPERALMRFSNMLLNAARDGTEQAGDTSEKLSAMLEKIFFRLEKDDQKAGERLRQAKDELFMRLSIVEETVSGAGHPAKTELLRQTQKLMDHVRIINSIEQFVYMQLPVKIGDENRTADLYLYKRKRGSKSIDPENVNILLALDLDNIGHWESLVNIKGKDVSLRMEVAGEAEKEYFSENTVKLHNLLAEAGFKLSGTSVTHSMSETTPLTALMALERYRTGRAGALDYTI